MSIMISIGELDIVKDIDDCAYKFCVKEVHLEDVPKFFGEIESNTKEFSNYAYSLLSNEMCNEKYNLYEHFIGGQKPNINTTTFILTKDDLAMLESLSASYIKRHPNVKIIYSSDLEENQKLLDCDWHFTRFSWLIFWVKWALNNCKNPAFYIE